jgi:uncharacterized coiled-coil protein SlyX
MNDNDYKSLILVYQQKAFDLFSQVVALEAKMNIANKTIESLSSKVSEQENELNKLLSKTTKKTSTKTDIDSEGF